MKKFIAAVILSSLTGCADDIQKTRVAYCDKVLLRETCRILVKDGAYSNRKECATAMTADGFCNGPIDSTISEITKCTLQVSAGQSMPDSCIRLKH